MKRLLLTFLLSVATLILFSQTVKTRLADPNPAWNNPAAWSPAGNPASGDHIIVPAGVELNMNQSVTIGFLEVQNGGIINITSTINIGEPSTFDNGSIINWNSGTLTGGSEITNNSSMLLDGTGNKSILGETTLSNNNEIIIAGAGDLLITNGTVNNNFGALIEQQANNGNIAWSGGATHVLNNSGTISKTTSAGEATITVELFNTGSINVESGTLSLQGGLVKNLTGGTYNVSEGAVFDWDGTVALTGDITGAIDGQLNWNSQVIVEDQATFNFDNSGSINWTNNNLVGGGVLTNTSTINLTGAGNKTILENSQLINEGQIYITTSGDLFITQGIVTNSSEGLIEMQAANGNISWSGGAVHVLNNFGLIRKTGEGEAQIAVELNNNNGSLSVESGTLSLQFLGKNLNQGTYDVAEGAVFDWDTPVSAIGSLTGTIDGVLNWNNSLEIPVGEEASFDFLGTGDINWTTNSLTGGGVLVNNTTLNLISTPNKIILEDSQLDNNGDIIISGTGDLFITQGIVNNNVSGRIEMQTAGGNISWSGGTVHVLNNDGEISRTTSEGEAQIFVELYNNSSGVINVETGTLSFQSALGKNLNGGTYNVSEGAVFDWDGSVVLLNTISGEINGTLNWNNVVNIPEDEQATFAFTGSGSVNWTTNSLQGGGTLVNQTTINLTGAPNKVILQDTHLSNEGTINITSTGDLFITQATVTNELSGVIDLQAAAGNISWSGGTSHVLINSGEIKRSSTEGEVQIVVELFNTEDGIINVETGILSFQNAIGKHLDGGTYNVAEGAVFDWDAIVFPTSEITGVIDGSLNWNGQVSIAEEEESIFSFTGNGDFNWTGSNLIGGGTLINNSVLNLSNSLNKSIFDNTHLVNENRINLFDNGDLFITQGVVTNSPEAIFDIQNDAAVLTYSGGTSHEFINQGLLIKSAGDGVSTNFVDLTNEGNFEIVSGTFRNLESYTGGGKISGEGAFQPLGSQELDGTISPGLMLGEASGTLSYTGNFNSSALANLEIDLNGLTPDTQYDVFQIQGDAELNGQLEVNLGFTPEIGDEFIVLTTTGDITSCNLPDTETVLSGINNFIFTISCQNDNQVVLELVAIGGNGDYNMDGAITIIDLSGFLAEFGSTGEGLIGDFNGDGAVTSADLSSFLSVFGLVY